ncbi:MAG: DNA polymerase IV [Candidatus Omnitrophica bacterium]|nr:DNA polymerase IV [Candidatus Omnitrophota bacterium]
MPRANENEPAAGRDTCSGRTSQDQKRKDQAGISGIMTHHITMADKNRYIVHVDMDAFFASVEQRDDPSIKGRPVIVGADPKKGAGRGVVAACSYEARKYGIHSAMPISTAYKKCPKAVFLRPDSSKYSAVSREVFAILENFTPEIEPISIDEAFMDITGSFHLFGTPEGTCRKIKQEIRRKTALTASIGLAPNKMTAKIASEVGKPDGLVIVKPGRVLDFLHPLPVGRLWGIGEKTLSVLESVGIRTIGDLAAKGEEELEDLFGKNGRHMYLLSSGMDGRSVETTEVIKSISNEHTFEEDATDNQVMFDTLMHLSEKVSRRMRRSGLKGRTVTLKIRFSNFKTYTRSHTLDQATNYVDDIYGKALEKIQEFDTSRRAVRLLGVKVSNLTDDSWRSDLFRGTDEEALKKERLHRALDRIMEKYGSGAVRRRRA